jgi:hypothetical protein
MSLPVVFAEALPVPIRAAATPAIVALFIVVARR